MEPLTCKAGAALGMRGALGVSVRQGGAGRVKAERALRAEGGASALDRPSVRAWALRACEDGCAVRVRTSETTILTLPVDSARKK